MAGACVDTRYTCRYTCRHSWGSHGILRRKPSRWVAGRRNHGYSNGQELGDGRLVDVVAGVAVDHPAVLHHQNAVGNFENETQHLLAHHDAEIAKLADLLEELRDLLDHRGLDALG